MGLGLLFLAVLATLVSCEDPEGNRVFGGRGAYRVPQRCWHLAGPVFPSREQDLCHVPVPRLGTREAVAGLEESWWQQVDVLLTTAGVGGWAETSLRWACTTSLRVSEGWGTGGKGGPRPPAPALLCLAPCDTRRPGYLLVWHSAHLLGGLQGEAQGAEEEPVWERQLLLAGLQVLLPRYSQRGDGGGLGMAAGLGTASLAGFVPCP